MQKLVNKKVHEWNNYKWDRVIINSNTKDGPIWKLVKRFTKKKTAIPPLNVGTRILFEDTDKANVFVEQFGIKANQKKKTK